MATLPMLTRHDNLKIILASASIIFFLHAGYDKPEEKPDYKDRGNEDNTGYGYFPEKYVVGYNLSILDEENNK